MIIAIDGPAGAGKSTTARLLAKELGFDYIDTGAMYRAVALAAFERGLTREADTPQIAEMARLTEIKIADGGARIFLGPRDVTDEIRAPHIGMLTSKVAAIPAVRSALVEAQQKLGREGQAQSGGAVLEGRDIQTIVFPDAEVKVFLDADPRTRAKRRVEQWAEKGQAASLEETEHDMAERDARDSEREVAPLRAAPDALVLSTEGKTPERVVAEIVAVVKSRRA